MRDRSRASRRGFYRERPDLSKVMKEESHSMDLMVSTESADTEEAIQFWLSWDRDGVTLKKSDFEQDFEYLLEVIMIESPGGYETTLWGNAMQQRWESLPNTLRRELPMSTGALAVLSSQFDDAVYQGYTFREEDLRRPTFQVLGAAQSLALAAGADSIRSTHVIGSLVDWWITVYPLCTPPAAMKRRRLWLRTQ